MIWRIYIIADAGRPFQVLCKLKKREYEKFSVNM